MSDKVLLLLPEIVLFAATCIVMIVGLSPSLHLRRTCGWIAGLALLIAMGLSAPRSGVPESGIDALFPQLMPFAKGMIAAVGLLLLPLMAGVVDRESEDEIERGSTRFNPLRSNRAEFYAFFLFSLTGLMLCASADDLIWLFLALELTSLPTYIMVTISMQRGGAESRSQEAGVKYFFLGALGAAVFLYGFALLYGATGSTSLPEIAAELRPQAIAGDLNPIATAGLIVAFLGLCFKIAAVPMHFYAADVYQGAAAGVSAFLAFVPKTAGFLAIILLFGTVGWEWNLTERQLPEQLHWVVWIIAAATMTVGNVLALLQTSLKRLLAYSSVAHSGYMLAAVLAGPSVFSRPDISFFDNGIAAVLFYLLSYGVMNLGAFAVIASLERRRAEAGSAPELDHIDDLRGLNRTHPHLAAAMLLCGLSLLGFPPLLGFFGKLGLFTSIISTGNGDMYALAVVLGVNSAIAALYYLRLVVAAYLDPRDDTRPGGFALTPFPTRPIAALASAGGVVVATLFVGPLTENSTEASRYAPAPIERGSTSGQERQTASADTAAPSAEAGTPTPTRD